MITDNVTAAEDEAAPGTDEINDSDDFDIFPPLYAQARELFVNPDIIPAEDVDLKWNEPDEEGLKAFLVGKMGFSADRVASGIKKLQEAQQKKAQKRLDR